MMFKLIHRRVPSIPSLTTTTCLQRQYGTRSPPSPTRGRFSDRWMSRGMVGVMTSPPQHQQQQQQCRRYAIAANCHNSNCDSTTSSSPGSNPTQIAFTHIWPTDPNPSPYQIFNTKQGEPYSKRRYYELCMLYHPDRSCASTGPDGTIMGENVRSDRFKLVVAANEILSCERKRWAYDQYGVGWGAGSPSSRGHGRGIYRHANGGRGSHHHQHPNRRRDENGRWTEEPDTRPWWKRVDWTGREGYHDPNSNATWEDWERYYAWRDSTFGGSKTGSTSTSTQSPIYLSNTTFIVFLALFSLVGGLATLNHAQANGMEYIAQRDMADERIRSDMVRRRKEVEGLSDREERVRRFLRVRDPYGELNERGLVQEKYRRLMPGGLEDGGRCGGEGIRRLGDGSGEGGGS